MSARHTLECKPSTPFRLIRETINNIRLFIIGPGRIIHAALKHRRPAVQDGPIMVSRKPVDLLKKVGFMIETCAGIVDNVPVTMNYPTK
jgi:hypothetical protein